MEKEKEVSWFKVNYLLSHKTVIDNEPLLFATLAIVITLHNYLKHYLLVAYTNAQFLIFKWKADVQFDNNNNGRIYFLWDISKKY